MVMYCNAKHFWYMTVNDSIIEPKMKRLLHCVYILLSHKDNQFYIGYTANLHERLTSHINGNSFATSFRRPFELLFCINVMQKYQES